CGAFEIALGQKLRLIEPGVGAELSPDEFGVAGEFRAAEIRARGELRLLKAHSGNQRTGGLPEELGLFKVGGGGKGCFVESGEIVELRLLQAGVTLEAGILKSRELCKMHIGKIRFAEELCPLESGRPWENEIFERRVGRKLKAREIGFCLR